MDKHTEYTEAASIAERAADHIARVGRTNDRWDLEQEAAGTPRAECRTNVIGAVATVAHGDPGARVSAAEGPADTARRAVIRHLGVQAFTDDLTPTTADAERALRGTASSLRKSAEVFRAQLAGETRRWCEDRGHPFVTYNPWTDRSYCRCGVQQAAGEREQDMDAKWEMFHGHPRGERCRCYLPSR
ncbi:hypothetical protein ACH4F6_38005 [Streptomyces sp. NPDC017936]|uniref:hypothetical protein n=1 Tax=Streptomyces sp. NPDC017936 TaxID=3365016 RepID=UPI0037AC6E12